MTALGRNKVRCLLSFLGICELFMAGGAAPAVLVVGGVGGLALIVAAWLRTVPRAVLMLLLAVGVLPFTALAWTAIVPVLLLVGVAAVAVPLVRRLPAQPRRLRPDR